MTEKKITFGRIFWPSFLAVLLVSILGMLVSVFIIGGTIASFGSDEPKNPDKNTVLHLTLNGDIAESSSSTFNAPIMAIESKIGLADLLYGFEQAKKDEHIKGIFLELKGAQCGMATAREIRRAINRFEKSGKFVIAYNAGEVITQKEYYISSAANTCYGFPSSMMEFVGLGSELTYFKNTLDMLEVEMQVIRGKNNDFKSAVEPFVRTDMSDSSRKQTERYVGEMWREMRLDIASDRKVSSEKLNQIAEEMSIKHASDAVKYNLLDGVKYRDEVLALLAKKSGVESTDKLALFSFEKYASDAFFKQQKTLSDANVAVILAEGDVTVDGDGVSSNKICQYLREVRFDPKIKTVVLRINSPGGSALASDEIWREVSLLNQKKKVIVSMGDVAASGGYYIATPASYIFAEAQTVTGSIGVFGVIPYTGKMLEDKLGLSFDQVKTNKHAVISTNRRLTEEEMTIIQEEVDVIYSDFLNRVSNGRGKTVEEVNQLARGRVWLGSDAKKIGLVDELGGLTDAIAYSVKKAGIKNPVVQYYPKKKEHALQAVLDLLEEEEQSEVFTKQPTLPRELLKQYEKLNKLQQYLGIQMRLPFELEIR